MSDAEFVVVASKAMMKALRDDGVEAVVVAVVKHREADVFAYAVNTETASQLDKRDVREYARYKLHLEAALDTLCRVVYQQQRRRN